MATRDVQRTRIIAIVFTSLAIVTLIAFVYAFIQQGLARKSEQTAIENSEKATQCEQLANEMQIVAEHRRIEFQKKYEALEQELVKLRNSRTK